MSTAGNAILLTVGLFCGSFAMIFAFYVADRLRAGVTGRR